MSLSSSNSTMSMSTIDKVEILVSLISRAFYPDEEVVIFDFLMREKFVAKTEIAPRLKMEIKKCEKAVNGLISSRMVSVEVVAVPEMGSDGKEVYKEQEYLFIDYLWFVHYVRLRIHVMIDKAESTEKNPFHNCKTFFKCPTCDTPFTGTQAFQNKNGEGKFMCASCCPHFPISTAPSHPRYTLIRVENKDYNMTSKLSKEKIKKQLQTAAYCGGSTTNILDLLRQLENVPLSRNFPSNNIKVGHEMSRISDEQSQKDISYVQSVEANRTMSEKRSRAYQEELKRKDETAAQKRVREDEEHRKRMEEQRRLNPPPVRQKKDTNIIQIAGLEANIVEPPTSSSSNTYSISSNSNGDGTNVNKMNVENINSAVGGSVTTEVNLKSSVTISLLDDEEDSESPKNIVNNKVETAKQPVAQETAAAAEISIDLNNDEWTD